MNKRSWSDDDLAEYDALVTDALREKAVPKRRDIFLDGLNDGVQGQRLWALDVLRDIRDNGADRILKREHENRVPRVPVSQGGDVPRVLGNKARDSEGHTVHQRTLFDYMTFEELRGKLAEYTTHVRAYERDIHAIVRLLVLESRVPSAANPAEACKQLGVTVEQWLLSEDAA